MGASYCKKFLDGTPWGDWGQVGEHLASTWRRISAIKYPYHWEPVIGVPGMSGFRENQK